MYLNSFDDLVNLVSCSKRFEGVLMKLHQNPISITQKQREYFPYLNTLSLYTSKDDQMLSDTTIRKRKIVTVKPYDLYSDHLKQLEEWTNLKAKKMIYDTNVDGWDDGTNEFFNKVLCQVDLVFLVDDDRGNLFGYYIFTKIFSGIETKETDKKAFLFSLESNGRMNQPMKFEIIDVRSGYQLSSELDDEFISLGGNAIVLKKGNKRHESFCIQNEEDFNYHGIRKALCGKSGLFNTFVLKRLRVIQFI